MSAASAARRPILVLGHRGAPLVAPENTLASFRRALAMGADGVELDVRRSGDGKLVVVHDPRMGVCRVSTTRYDRLCRTRRGEGLALLDDALRALRGAFVDIELKIAGVEEEVLALAARYCTPGRFVVTSFLRPVLVRVKELDHKALTGWLFDKKAGPDRWRSLDAEFLAPNWRVFDSRLAAMARSEGRRIITWTVNSPEVLDRVISLGAEIVISDVPDAVRAMVARRRA